MRNDFDGLAALVSELDLVISVDTSLAHLAGALGKPVWVLLACVPDWRWMLGRSDSPWYPTARLFRQLARGDWTHPLCEIEAALRLLVAERR
jgi:ADP-heptose:LPS heptosyltransferase